MRKDPRTANLLVLALCLPIVSAALAQEETKRPVDGIMDNSFLVEEAYNQEAGVVQHIFTRLYGVDKVGAPDKRTFDLAFTQVLNYNLGASAIYSVSGRLNLRLEWIGAWNESANDGGGTDRDFFSDLTRPPLRFQFRQWLANGSGPRRPDRPDPLRADRGCIVLSIVRARFPPEA